MRRLEEIADAAAARVCRARVRDLLRQGWTTSSLAACCDLEVAAWADIVQHRPLSWRTCDVVGDVFRELDGALRRYRESTSHRRAVRRWAAVSHAPLGRAS